MKTIELMQLLGDIVAQYMGLDSSRVVLGYETFDAPKDAGIYVLIEHDPIGIETVGVNRSYDYSADTETMGRASHEQFAIEIISRGYDAMNRYSEVQMALTSTIALQAAEEHGIRIFRNSDPMNLTAIEGSGPLRRYRIPVIVSTVNTKTSSVAMIDEYTEPTIKVEA